MADPRTDQPDLILQGPTEKEKKYDRQLRLWAIDGQQALEDAHILLINSGSGVVGVETLKNLVLPGIGRFTIADDATVQEQDLGVNFFLHRKNIGYSRAKCCVDLLQELNPDVKGFWRTLTGPQRLNLNESREAYTLIICSTPVDAAVQRDVNEYCRSSRVPLLKASSVGFYSYFHVHFPGNFPIVETHPDMTATTDLRLLNPWPELHTFVQTVTANLDEMTAYDHGHIPYVVLLIYYLEKWKGSHGGLAPKTYVDKVAFRDFVRAAARTENIEGGEENYDEAVAAVLKTVTKPYLSEALREVFDHKPSENESRSNFWIITDAIKRFYLEHGELPLPGSLPDMKSQSEIYVKLQSIYKRKARDDVAAVSRLVMLHPDGDSVKLQTIESYCKNAAFVKLIRENSVNTNNLRDLANSELRSDTSFMPSLLPIYLAMQGNENSISKSYSFEETLLEVSKTFVNAPTDGRIAEAIREVVRARGGELHNISALTGGMIAQEIIKIVTKQYVPINNTCVFDGIHSRTQVFRV